MRPAPLRLLGRLAVASIGSAALIGIGTVATAASAVDAGTAPSVALGVYAGAGNVSGAAAFAATTGTAVAVVADYQDGATWSSLSGAYPASAWAGSGYRLAIGVPMLPDGSIPGAGLLEGASGAYDAYFATLARNLVAEGAGDAIVRLGWEWDQRSFAWYVGNATDAADYAAYWQQVVTTMRAVPGANFDFSWYYGGRGTALTTDAWPGSDYVDSVTLDVYDQTWDPSCGLAWDNTATSAQSACVWDGSVLPELDGLAAFASAQGEPIGLGEWGVISRSDGHGLGDDPTFVDNLAAWVGSHDVEYADYFDANSGGDSVLTAFPAALSAFAADFGVPTPTTTTAPPTTNADAGASSTGTPDTVAPGSTSVPTAAGTDPSAPGAPATSVPDVAVAPDPPTAPGADTTGVSPSPPVASPDPATPSVPDPTTPSVPDPATPSLPDPATPSLPDPAAPSVPDPAATSVPVPASPDPTGVSVPGPAAAPAP